jgi:hypothetical protein
MESSQTAINNRMAKCYDRRLSVFDSTSPCYPVGGNSGRKRLLKGAAMDSFSIDGWGRVALTQYVYELRKELAALEIKVAAPSASTNSQSVALR